MPQNGYSIGRDVTIAVILPDGTPLRLGKVTGFMAKQDTTDQRIKPLDGTTDNLRFYDGWSGNFKLERRGPELDNYFEQLERNYYAGADEPQATRSAPVSRNTTLRKLSQGQPRWDGIPIRRKANVVPRAPAESRP